MKCITLFLSLLTLLLACTGGGTNDETTIRTGAVVYEPDGKTPADSVVVKIFDAASVDGKYISIQTTASDGRFYLEGLPIGTYVLWAQKDSLVTYQSAVVISPDDTTVHDVTLAVSSTVTGIVGVQPQDDPRTVTIQVVGLDKYFNNTSSDGRFIMKNMAAGRYTLLLKSTEAHYTPTTVEITIPAGATVVLNDTLWVTYTGIPVVSGLQVSYDTAAGIAQLSWNHSTYRGFENYCIYRDFYDSVNYSANPVAATGDTVFYDTIFSKQIGNDTFSFADSCDYHFRYRIAIRNNVNAIGPTFKYTDFVAVSPLKVKPVFMYSSVQVTKNLKFTMMYDRVKFGDILLAGEASVDDSVMVIANVTSRTRKLVMLEWMDSAGSVVRIVNCDSTEKTFSDSLYRQWGTAGIHNTVCVVTDNAGSKWCDTVRIGIIDDKPDIQLTIKDSLMGCTDSIVKNFRYAYGDTIKLHLAANDRFGSITNIQWSVGNAVSVGSDPLVFDTFTIVPDTAISHFSIIASVIDDDSNRVSDTLVVDPGLFAPATVKAGFRARTYQAGVVFKDKMWISGGVGIVQQTPKTSFTSLNDVWYSDNGKCWTQAVTNAPARSGHAFTVFNGKLWLIGGYASSWGKYKNDVWCSADGISWTCVTDSAAFSPRIYHCCVAFNGKMWIIGGLSRASHCNDVWSSVDGVTWEVVSDSAPFPQRCSHSCVVYDSKLWIIGGRDNGYNALNDVWSSVDGAEWKIVTADAGFSPRQGLVGLIYNNKIWIIGGHGFDVSDIAADIWNSSNGSTWSLVSDSSGFAQRAFHTGMIFNNRMWILAGMSGYQSLANDVWRSGAIGE
jgi:hypothetical protein